MTAREELGLALWRTQTLRGLADCTSPQTRDRFVGELLAAGWRPPLPEQGEGQSPWDAYVAAYRAYQETDPHGATAHPTAHHMHALEAALRVADAPAPRVFFPADTVPADVALMSLPDTIEGPVVALSEPDGVERRLPKGWGPALEIRIPSPEEWQAAIDQAEADRATAEWQHTEGTNP